MAQGGTLTRKQTAFVVALVNARTVESAAEASGISRRTAHRYLERPIVKAALASALDEALGHATRAAVGAMRSAVSTLEAIQQDEGLSPGVRVSAARAILEAGPRLREALDLAERVSALEQEMARDDRWR